jgi:UDP-glucose 4-epimerase
VVAISATRLTQGLRPVIYGDGSQTRDFVYVGDIARATRAALTATESGPVNVGTGRETRVIDVVSQLIRASGRAVEPELLPARAGEVSRACLDSGRAQQRLRWESQTSLERGLAETYRYFAEPSSPSPAASRPAHGEI